MNAALDGTGVWVAPLLLGGVPAEIRTLLRKPDLTAGENARVKRHFLLSREKCLDVIAAAGRTPQVSGGGSMDALCVSNSVQYPQLWVVEARVDFSGFYPFHVNRADDGTGTDEIGQMLSGRLMRYCFPVIGGLVLTMSCNSNMGWQFTFSGVNLTGEFWTRQKWAVRSWCRCSGRSSLKRGRPHRCNEPGR
ncbi:MAG: hypothetical protein ACR2PG_21770, partial [Hyphomicrobiaceae bacterium]